MLPCVGVEPGPTADPALSHPSPMDLRFSKLGSKEVKLHWTNPALPVKQYRVVYHSAEGQSPQEVGSIGSHEHLQQWLISRASMITHLH